LHERIYRAAVKFARYKPHPLRGVQYGFLKISGRFSGADSTGSGEAVNIHNKFHYGCAFHIHPPCPGGILGLDPSGNGRTLIHMILVIGRKSAVLL
jgi:hypothetical protein